MLFRKQIKPSVAPEVTTSNSMAIAAPDVITLGIDQVTGEPFSFPRRLLGSWHVRGMSGSGKTSLTLIPLASQLIASNFPVFIVDLGGDISFFQNTKRLAEKSGRRFRYLTLDPMLKSFHFPPLQTVEGERLHVSEVCQRLLRAFQLDFGVGVYGGSYYAAQALAATLSVLGRVLGEKDYAGLSEMDYYLNRPENVKAFKDASSIRMNVRFMLQYPQLSSHEDPEENILVERAITNGEVCYFFLPTLDEPIVSPLAAGLLYSTVVHVASTMAKLGRPRLPIYVIGDEAQEIIGKSLGALLAQGRKYGLRFVFANQSTSQLQTKDCDLRHAMFEGTSVKQYFTCVGDEDTEILQSLSLDKIKQLGGSAVRGMSTSVTFRDEIVRTLERDDVLRVSATFGQSFFLLNDGLGHHEPFVVQQTHDFPDLSEVAMPRKDSPQHSPRDAVTPLAPTSRVMREPIAIGHDTAVAVASLDERLRAMIQTKIAEESWELLPSQATCELAAGRDS